MTQTSCHRVDYYGLVRPKVGYRHAGDAAVIVAYEGKLLAGIVDVLGHGPEAHEVAMKAKHYLDNGLEPGDPLELLKGLHDTLRGTRGAAAGLAVLDSAQGLVRYAGVGNTTIRRFGTVDDRLVSVDGIVGGDHAHAAGAADESEPTRRCPHVQRWCARPLRMARQSATSAGGCREDCPDCDSTLRQGL